MRKVISFICILLITNCDSNSPSKSILEKEKQIVNYLQTKQGINISKESICMFFNGTMTSCTPCIEELPSFIHSLKFYCLPFEYDFYLVVNDEKRQILERLELNNLSVLLDSEYNLSRYGVDLAQNFLVEFDKNSNIVYCATLTSSSYNNILGRYQKMIVNE